MKSNLIARISQALAWPAVKSHEDTPKNTLGQNADSAAPDEKIPRDLASHTAVFANSGLSKPVWGLLRVQDVIR
jgi:hypothetical protein